jgi:hypothetical protein
VDTEVSDGDLGPDKVFHPKDPKENELCLPQGFVIVCWEISAR